MKSKKTANQAGFTIIEVIVSLIVITIIITGWLSLTSHTVRVENYVSKLPEIERIGSEKAVDLLKNSEMELANFPANTKFVGTLSPESPMAGYYDKLDESGAIILTPPANQISTQIPVYTRQWKIVKDVPDIGDVTVYVSVVYIGAGGKVSRIVRKTQTELID